MKKNKKMMVLLASSILVAMVTGCSSGGSSTGDSTASGSTTSVGSTSNETKAQEVVDTGIYTENGTYPVIKEGESVTISAFAPLRTGVTSYDASENKFTAWLEETTGVSFEFQTSLEVDAQQKFNTIMVGGNLPDIFLFSANYPLTLSEQLLYGEQGSIIPLNDLIDQYMPNLKKFLEENEVAHNSIVLSDGNIYTLPSVGIGQESHAYNAQKMWINQTWLDNLGLEMPTTTEEFYETLKAFKEQDANGNGDPNDEIPLTGSPSGWNTDPTVFLMNAFGPYNKTNTNMLGLTVDENGSIRYAKVTDEWKEGLKYMNRLFEEGLLDSLALTQTGPELQKIGSNPGDTLIGACAGGSIPPFTPIGENNRWQEYVTVPPLEGPDGFRQAVSDPSYGKSGLVITSECENVEAVVRAFDLLYTEEGAFGNILGVKGVDYVDANEGDLNYVGEQAQITRIHSSTEAGNNAWAQLGPWYMPSGYVLRFTAVPDIEQVLYMETMKNYTQYSAAVESLVPPMAMTEAQSRAIIDVEVPMEQYVGQTTAEFIMGAKDIDATWDEYLKNVNTFGLENYLAAYQEIYDAQTE